MTTSLPDPVYVDAPPRFLSWDWLLSEPPGVYALVAASRLRIREGLVGPTTYGPYAEVSGLDVALGAEGICTPGSGSGSRIATSLVQPRAFGIPEVCLWIDSPEAGIHWTDFATRVENLRAWRTRWSQSDPARKDTVRVVCRTDDPYFLDASFTAAQTFVLSPGGRVARLDQHPDIAKWHYGLQTGELVVALGDVWPDVAGNFEKETP